MKKLSLIVVGLVTILGFNLGYGDTLPEPSGYVVDTVGILNSQTRGSIESICKELDPTIQLAVCIVKTTEPLSDAEYGVKLAEKWKVGYKGKDNGIIFLVVTEDRRVRIEVGYGLESVINDAKAGRILDESVVPYLKQGKWNEGILSGVLAIKKEVSR